MHVPYTFIKSRIDTDTDKQSGDNVAAVTESNKSVHQGNTQETEPQDPVQRRIHEEMTQFHCSVVGEQLALLDRS